MKPLDTRTSLLTSLVALLVVIASAIIATLIGSIPTEVSAVAGRDISFAACVLMLTMAAFGGMPEGRLDLPTGAIGVNLAVIPFLLTALACYIIFRGHNRAERRNPLFDPADRLMNAILTGMVLVIAMIVFWGITKFAAPADARIVFEANIFFMAAGALLVGAGSAGIGRQSVHVGQRRAILPAFTFAARTALIVALPIGLVLCIYLTLTEPWGRMSWLLLGNMGTAAWSALNGGIISWSISGAPVGFPVDSGLSFLLAFPRANVWTGVAVIICSIITVLTTIAWARTCHRVTRFALPMAYMAFATLALAAGCYVAGYVNVGSDTVRVSAQFIISPLSIPIAGLIALGIDTVARMISATRNGNPMPGAYPHPQPGTGQFFVPGQYPGSWPNQPQNMSNPS